MHRVVRVTVAVLLLSGCVGHARTNPDYVKDVHNTTKIVVSTLETARLTSDAVEQRRTTAAYAALLLSEAESDAQSTLTAFSSVQPPSPELDALRTQVITAMNEAASVLGDMRLAAFRDDSRSLIAAAKRIPAVRDQLRRIGQEVSA